MNVTSNIRRAVSELVKVEKELSRAQWDARYTSQDIAALEQKAVVKRKRCKEAIDRVHIALRDARIS